MLLKSLFALIASAFLIDGSLQTADYTESARNQSSYVKVEVRGTLRLEGPAHYIEAYDSVFPDVKLLVKLQRSEDKNRHLDRQLEGLEGKSVVANGFLVCGRVGQEAGVISIYFSSESQIRAAGDDVGALRDPRSIPS